mmetsp:Transcript_12670/g.20643  ORF Transcript_12670/g.20643 Transcript_12670/m.20643 type:complete len:982 (+) Transcript_12670:292-3237(+)
MTSGLWSPRKKSQRTTSSTSARNRFLIVLSLLASWTIFVPWLLQDGGDEHEPRLKVEVRLEDCITLNKSAVLLPPHDIRLFHESSEARKLTVAIPRRWKETESALVHALLGKLFLYLSPYSFNEVRFVVLCDEQVCTQLMETYSDHIESGNLAVVVVPDLNFRCKQFVGVGESFHEASTRISETHAAAYLLHIMGKSLPDPHILLVNTAPTDETWLHGVLSRAELEGWHSLCFEPQCQRPHALLLRQTILSDISSFLFRHLEMESASVGQLMDFFFGSRCTCARTVFSSERFDSEWIRVSIWPKPLSMSLGSSVAQLSSEATVHAPPEASQVADMVQKHLKTMTTESCTGTLQDVYLVLRNSNQDDNDSGGDGDTGDDVLDRREDYTLVIEGTAVTLTAPTISGLHWAFQTFVQATPLLWGCRWVPRFPLAVTDRPMWKYRGFLLDTARNYFEVSTITRIIRQMAASKINTLHWHMANDQSFAFQSKAVPDIGRATNTKYGHSSSYSIDEVKYIVQEASRMGVRIIPEIPMPTHAGGWGVRDILSNCPIYACQTAWSIPLNPMLNKTYDVIEKVLVEIKALFPLAYVHLGGDEFSHECWNEDPSIPKAKKDSIQSADASEALHRLFEERLHQIIKHVGLSVVRWADSCSAYPDGAAQIIQLWGAHVPPQGDMATCLEGKDVLFVSSDRWYFNDNCLHWAECYGCSPADKLQTWDRKLSGVEASAWEFSETTFSQHNIWLRLLATAERMWSEGMDTDGNVRFRLRRFCMMLVQEGILEERMCDLDTVPGRQLVKVPEFQRREGERDEQICRWISPNGTCSTGNCLRERFISFQNAQGGARAGRGRGRRTEARMPRNGRKRDRAVKPTEGDIKAAEEPKLRGGVELAEGGSGSAEGGFEWEGGVKPPEGGIEVTEGSVEQVEGGVKQEQAEGVDKEVVVEESASRPTPISRRGEGEPGGREGMRETGRGRASQGEETEGDNVI